MPTEPMDWFERWLRRTEQGHANERYRAGWDKAFGADDPAIQSRATHEESIAGSEAAQGEEDFGFPTR